MSTRQDIAALETQLLQALQRGDERRAEQVGERILALDGSHARALLDLAQRAFRGGDLARARGLLERLVAAHAADKQHWINLAVVCQAQQDEAGEEAAIRAALSCDATDLVALILRANLYRRQGKRHAAANAFGAVAAVAPPLDRLAPQLRPAVQEAQAYRDQYQSAFGQFLDAQLAPVAAGMRGENLHRFQESLDIMLGRKQRYDSQSALFHVQGLAPITFSERADFPWLDAFEAATATVRDEFLAVLADDQGFIPYLQYEEDQPLNQFAELNKSPRWSAFHLIDKGAPHPQNAARVPRTMALLATAPQPDQPGRTPVAMFSCLKPKTRIPPHCGVSNARLVTHLPLIVPPGCAFRVGNDVRPWVEGKAWVFDDTIDHEAWNDSEQLRVILMFDIWHPHLSAAERAMITAMTHAINAFTESDGGYAL